MADNTAPTPDQECFDVYALSGGMVVQYNLDIRILYIRIPDYSSVN